MVAAGDSWPSCSGGSSLGEAWKDQKSKLQKLSWMGFCRNQLGQFGGRTGLSFSESGNSSKHT